MPISKRSVSAEIIPSRKREPNGNRSIALAYIQGQCGSLFRRGFSLVAHRDKLYVRTSGTKIPLFLDLSSSWQDVQRRAAQLQEELKRAPHDPDDWKYLVLGGRIKRAGMTLQELEVFWQRRKEAEGIQARSYANDHARFLRRLDPKRPLSSSSLMDALAKTEPGSLNRNKALALYRNIAKAVGHPWNGDLFDAFAVKGYRMEKKVPPLFTDPEIEEIVTSAWARGQQSWSKVLALMAIYGLRPWEAWYAEPSSAHEHCAWIPIGKRNSKGANPPREVPPFHRRWLDLFRIEEAWKLPSPPIPKKGLAGCYTNIYMRRNCDIPANSGKSAYGFRNAYARRIHGVDYRVTDGDGAAFMGHTVMIHNAVYRRWVAGFDDPISRYF